MRRAVTLAVLAIFTILGAARPGVAQPSEDLKDLRKEVDALKQGQKAIQSDLQEIKNLLRARPTAAAPPVLEAVISFEGAPVKGDKNAKVTLVDFTDYQ
jgi:hypothetical protein